jgi:hypothetical protein
VSEVRRWRLVMTQQERWESAKKILTFNYRNFYLRSIVQDTAVSSLYAMSDPKSCALHFVKRQSRGREMTTALNFFDRAV